MSALAAPSPSTAPAGLPGRRRALIVAAALCTAALAGVYALSRGTRSGRRLDERAKGFEPSDHPLLSGVASLLLDPAVLASVAVLALACVVAAVLRDRRSLALGAAVAALAANLTTQALKPALGALDPFGGDALRETPAAFPSGHATVAASLAVVLVMSAPARWRRPAALFGGVYASAVAVAVVALQWHYPSDVFGTFLVMGAWSALGIWVATARCAAARPQVAIAPSGIGRPVALACVAFVAVGALVLAIRADALEFVRENAAFVGAAAGLVLMGATLSVLVGRVTHGRPEIGPVLDVSPLPASQPEPAELRGAA